MSEHDTLRRFIFERLPVQGRHVHLDASWRAALERQDYPAPVRALLGEAMAAAVLLSATLKFDGSITLQVQGTGPVHLLVVQCTSGLNLRGLARWTGELGGLGFRSLVGDGRLVMTIEQRNKTERYQSIVPLEGETLSSSLESYFARSEQLATRLWLTAGDASASGMLLQMLPDKQGEADAWQHVTVLSDTLKQAELAGLSAQEILHRLYNEDDVRLFEGTPVAFRCQCSRGRIEDTLRGLGHDEVQSILKEQGRVEVDCEFCGRRYSFDMVDVESLFAGEFALPAGPARH
ncbi:MAG TPA: Hsp33 family molecular chaperone HslO [Gammaproteobacteria bacterium]|nr:Hsp33 family molecular chaperone HslO [Gammaproteobacteria bacterium]